MRRAGVAMVLGLATLATRAPVLHGQHVAPAGLVVPRDSAPAARRVRDFPIVFASALVGGGVGLFAGAFAGAALGATADDGQADSIISGEGIGAILGAGIGYAVGAGTGAHFGASTRPRPNAAATIGISVLAAAGVGALAGIANATGGTGGQATAVITAIAAPVVHLALTAQFARWRARTRAGEGVGSR